MSEAPAAGKEYLREQPHCLLEPCSTQHTPWLLPPTLRPVSTSPLGDAAVQSGLYVCNQYLFQIIAAIATDTHVFSHCFFPPPYLFIPLLFLLLPSGTLLTLIDYKNKVRSCSMKASLLCYILNFGAGFADCFSLVKPFIFTYY